MAPRKWSTFKKSDVGKYKEGFGIVLVRDVGKMYYKQDGSYFVENDAQFTKRTGKANPRGKRKSNAGGSDSGSGNGSGKLIPAKVRVSKDGTVRVFVNPRHLKKNIVK